MDTLAASFVAWKQAEHPSDVDPLSRIDEYLKDHLHLNFVLAHHLGNQIAKEVAASLSAA